MNSKIPILTFTVLAALAVPATAESQADQIDSLREGNRLYREGRLEEACESYLAGYEPHAPHPVLTYNMATTWHHLGRLPEAILWYRRAAAVNPGDPWMRENLSRARASLGLQPYPAPGVAGLVSRQASLFSFLAAILAWFGLALWITRSRRSSRLAIALVAAGVVLYGLTHLAILAAPRAAVVLEQCSGAEADLPAGSEIWVSGEAESGYKVVAGRITLECPRAAVSLVSEAG